MFTGRIVTMHCLLLFGILALLQHVSSYVAQLPNTIAEPIQISSLGTPDDSSTTTPNG